MRNGIITVALGSIACLLSYSCANDSDEEAVKPSGGAGGTVIAGAGGEGAATSTSGGSGQTGGMAGSVAGDGGGGGETVEDDGGTGAGGGGASGGEGGVSNGVAGESGAAGSGQRCIEFGTEAAVGLQNATATFSQTSFGGNPITAAIDGQLLENNGWSIYEGSESDGTDAPAKTHAQTAVFETVFATGAVGSVLIISLDQRHSLSGHQLGRFRLSVTSDPRSEFADGALSNGDVTAAWEALHPISATATGGITLSVLSDQSILASGATPTETVYTIVADAPFGAITGFRLEAMEDDSLPDSGPGRYSNGNFVLTEFEVRNKDCARF
jgi:hypothetical protein